MYPSVKAKWITALRSSEFIQNFGRLHRGDNFCVLGVLTELYRREHGGKWQDTGDSESQRGMAFCAGPDADFTVQGWNNRWSYTTLVIEVQDWAGLDTPLPTVPTLPEDIFDELEISLTKLNDNGYTFIELAQRIEDNL